MYSNENYCTIYKPACKPENTMRALHYDLVIPALQIQVLVVPITLEIYLCFTFFTFPPPPPPVELHILISAPLK